MKLIPGYDYYYADEDGVIYTWYKTGIRPMKPRKNNSGYFRVILDGKEKLVHRLVAITFLPNPENHATVDHIDCDKSNNSVSNLQWCSLKDNVKNYRRHLTQKR